MSNPPSRNDALQLVQQAGGEIPDWRLAKLLNCSTRDLVYRMGPIVGQGPLRRFHKKSIPCYGLTDEGRASVQPVSLQGPGKTSA